MCHLNLASDFDVAEGRRVLLDVQRTQQRVRSASEQLERVNTTVTDCTKYDWYAQTGQKAGTNILTW